MSTLRLMFTTILLNSFIYNANSAIIEVQPGVNTFSNALESASEGDTLLLAGGTYSESGTVRIDKPITVKGASRDNKPEFDHINMKFRRDSDNTSYGDVVLQNIFFNDGFVADEGVFNTFRSIAFIGNSFLEPEIKLEDTFNNLAVSRTLIFADNNFGSSNKVQSINVAATDLLVIAGNKISNTVFADDTNGRNGGLQPVLTVSYVDKSQECYIVGNEFTTGIYRWGSGFVDWSCDKGVIAGNRFTMAQRYVPSDFEDFNPSNPERPYALRIRRHRADINNNILSVQPPEGSSYATSDISDWTVRAIFIDDNSEGELINIKNNVFDWSQNGNIATPLTSNSLIGYSIGSRAPNIENNVFYQTDNINVVSAALIPEFDIDDTFNNNLCFGDIIGCSGSSLSDDPKFVDTIDFVPADDSPLIDAGTAGNTRLDIDGSRNDIGVYGGHTPIHQYLDQLKVENQDNPLIYPLRSAGEGLTTNSNLAVKVLSVARAQ